MPAGRNTDTLCVFASENDDPLRTNGLRLRPTSPCGASNTQLSMKRRRRWVLSLCGWTDVPPCGSCPCSVSALTFVLRRSVSLQQFVNVTRTSAMFEKSRGAGNVKYAAGHTLGRLSVDVTYTTSPFVSTFAQFPATTFTLPPGQITSVSAAERLAPAATAASNVIVLFMSLSR